MELTGKVCVVTGASSGIGEQTARDLAQAGAIVVAAARREDRLAALVEALPGQQHTYKVTDVGERASVAALAGHVKETYGRCDALINNAGFSAGGAFRGKDSIEDVAAMMSTNFFGAVYCVGEFLELLEASAPASVVNVASIAGRVGLGNASGYCASKFALAGWSEGLRYELEPRGVHVSLVMPGPIPTEGFPQSDLSDHPVLRYAIGSVSDVSGAIRSAIHTGKAELSVPRFYHALQLPRLVAPALHRAVVKRVVNRRMN